MRTTTAWGCSLTGNCCWKMIRRGSWNIPSSTASDSTSARDVGIFAELWAERKLVVNLIVDRGCERASGWRRCFVTAARSKRDAVLPFVLLLAIRGATGHCPVKAALGGPDGQA